VKVVTPDICVCVCVRERVCVYAHAHARSVCVCERESVWADTRGVGGFQVWIVVSS